jgi:IS30 family transposase
MSVIAMGTKYDHLTLDERCSLRGLMEIGLGPGDIARRLGRHRGTIYREIARNRCASGYRPDSADRMAWVRKLRGPKIQRSTRLRDYVGDRLAMGWSPAPVTPYPFFRWRRHTQGAPRSRDLLPCALVNSTASRRWRS